MTTQTDDQMSDEDAREIGTAWGTREAEATLRPQGEWISLPLDAASLVDHALDVDSGIDQDRREELARIVDDAAAEAWDAAVRAADEEHMCEYGTCDALAVAVVEGAKPGDVALDDRDGHFCDDCAAVVRAERAEEKRGEEEAEKA